MLDLWLARGLVRERALDSALVEELRARGRSTVEQYAARAEEFLEGGHHEYAARCFDRAGNKPMVAFVRVCTNGRFNSFTLLKETLYKMYAHNDQQIQVSIDFPVQNIY